MLSPGAVSTDNAIALTLKVVCGLLDGRDRARVRDHGGHGVAADLAGEADARGRPSELEEVGPRVAAVLGVVYSMFNEGHTRRSGALMRLDLQAEALRLGRLFCDLVPREPEAFGLVAMMAFSAARAHTRVDAEGVPVLLDAQDRSKWNKELLREGLMALQRARSLGGRGPYVLQAEIAAAHVTAPTWESTDWAAIVALYDELPASPIVAMNRAVALSMRDGPAAGSRL